LAFKSGHKKMRACGADPHSPDKLNYEFIQLNF